MKYRKTHNMLQVVWILTRRCSVQLKFAFCWFAITWMGSPAFNGHQEARPLSSNSCRASVLQHHLQLELQPAIVSPTTAAAGDFPRGLPGLPSAELLWERTSVRHQGQSQRAPGKGARICKKSIWESDGLFRRCLLTLFGKEVT